MSGLHRSSSSSKNIGNCLPSKELLDDLCSRFVLNVPEEDQQSFERILFLVEYAYWYYEDNAVENDPKLKSLSLKEFTSLCILHCLLIHYSVFNFLSSLFSTMLVNDRTMISYARSINDLCLPHRLGFSLSFPLFSVDIFP
jgi:hypothetical protein